MKTMLIPVIFTFIILVRLQIKMGMKEGRVKNALLWLSEKILFITAIAVGASFVIVSGF